MEGVVIATTSIEVHEQPLENVMKGMGNDMDSVEPEELVVIKTLVDLNGSDNADQQQENVYNDMEPTDEDFSAPPETQFDKMVHSKE